MTSTVRASPRGAMPREAAADPHVPSPTGSRVRRENISRCDLLARSHGAISWCEVVHRHTCFGTVSCMNSELLEALTRMPPIENLAGAVMASVGASNAEEFTRIPVLGYHTSVGVDTASVYIVTDRVFAMFEANAAGRSYTLTVALPRVRRIGRLEDATYTRVVIELEADQATTVSTVADSGRVDGVVIPAGYELLETEPAGRAALRRFQASVSMALSL